MAQSSTFGTAETLLYLLADSSEDNGIRGRLYFPVYDEYRHFESLTSMVREMDSYLNTLRLPRKTHDFRSFQSKTAAQQEKGRDVIVNAKDYKTPESGNKATFVIKIKFRQNATFQGSIQWIDKNKTRNFRSDLEMLKLIDEAISENEPADNVSWEEN